MIESVAGAIVSAMPVAIMTMRHTMAPYDELSIQAEREEQPGRSRAPSPVATTSLAPKRSTKPSRQRGDDHHRDREREQPHTRLERRVPEHELEVLRQQEDRPEHREERRP